MREKDVHNLIEQQDIEAKQRVYDNIMSQVSFPESTAKAKPRRTKWFALASVLVCLVVLAIVLPLTLQGGTEDEGVRFCDPSMYEVLPMSQTLKQYSQTHGGDILYVDWYDITEDEVLTRYALNVDNLDDIIYLSEIIINDEGYEVTLYVADTQTVVDLFADFQNNPNELNVGGIMVKWQSDGILSTRVTFTYKNYNYYLSINAVYDSEQISSLVAGMLNSKS